MDAITLRPATPADSERISQIHQDALETYHEFYAAFFQNHPRELMPLATLRALNDPQFTFWVAELAGEMAGFVRYRLVVPANTNANANVVAAQETQGQPLASIWAPKEHLKELWERFNERSVEMDKCREEAVDGKKHFGISSVSQLLWIPLHQRKGIGAHLLRHVIDKADADGLPILIISSAEAHGLYRRMGFESLGTWPIDNERWADEIAEHEEKLGIAAGVGDGNNLRQVCRGMSEVEDCMIRLPAFRNAR
ncbi:hypothetical protein FZEAL_9125 [Fusarium zealandicum]|uniref:N-acetyltransferase domain-containing protein n=1 Tax=Fusarium zealandicum TaxID=1053134 RepID=A0A8H4UD40_9HYPO|nr:hypothetical protein FZEAL_9125 [Fusarium zealandicum]